MPVGRLLGITRESAAKFTFLMSAPIILADDLYHAMEMVYTLINIVPFIAVVLTAAIVGALCIGFFLNYLKTKGFGIFAFYRSVFGAFVIILYCLKSSPI